MSKKTPLSARTGVLNLSSLENPEQNILNIKNEKKSTKSILKNLKINGKKILKDDEIDKIIKLKFKSGEKLIDNKEILYEIISNILKEGFKDTHNILISEKWNNARDLILKLPSLRSANKKIMNDIHISQSQLEVTEGIYTCVCGSKRTFSVWSQTRGADEPPTVFITCSVCGNHWRKG